MNRDIQNSSSPENQSLSDRVEAIENLLENLIMRDAQAAFKFYHEKELSGGISILEFKKSLLKMESRLSKNVLQKIEALPDYLTGELKENSDLVLPILELLFIYLKTFSGSTIVSDLEELQHQETREILDIEGINKRDSRIYKEIYESIFYDYKIKEIFSDLSDLYSKYPDKQEIKDLYYISLKEINQDELLKILMSKKSHTLMEARFLIEILGEKGEYSTAYDWLEKFSKDFPENLSTSIALEAYLLFLEWKTTSKVKLLDLAQKMIQKVKGFSGYEGYIRNLILLSKKIITLEHLPDSLEMYYRQKLILQSKEGILVSKRVFINSIGMEFVYIPPGEYMMGASNYDEEALDSEKPLHKVRITKGFYMSKYLTTQSEWEAIMGNNPSEFKEVGPRAPVDSVSYEQIQIFIKKLNYKESREKEFGYRLPTESEWEYACRGGSSTIYYFGNDPNLLGVYSYYKENSEYRTHPVGEKKPNSWDLYDLHGMLWEWCEDWYEENYYQNSPQENPKGPSQGLRKTLRGGSWNLLQHRIRASSRDSDEPKTAFSIHGFRLVLSEDAIY